MAQDGLLSTSPGWQHLENELERNNQHSPKVILKFLRKKNSMITMNAACYVLFLNMNQTNSFPLEIDCQPQAEHAFSVQKASNWETEESWNKILQRGERRPVI